MFRQIRNSFTATFVMTENGRYIPQFSITKPNGTSHVFNVFGSDESVQIRHIVEMSGGRAFEAAVFYQSDDEPPFLDLSRGNDMPLDSAVSILPYMAPRMTSRPANLLLVAHECFIKLTGKTIHESYISTAELHIFNRNCILAFVRAFALHYSRIIEAYSRVKNNHKN